jgi:hypothetical protein
MLLLSLRCPELAEGSKYPTLISSYFLFCEIQRGTYRSPKPPRQLNPKKYDHSSQVSR